MSNKKFQIREGSTFCRADYVPEKPNFEKNDDTSIVSDEDEEILSKLWSTKGVHEKINH